MTNAMIILMESVKLMEEGVIGTTGKKVLVETQEGKKELDMPEPIHTFARWKQLGFGVKKGEHAVAKFPIWKYTTKKKKEETEEEAQENGHCYMRVASFFKFSQVQKLDQDNDN